MINKRNVVKKNYCSGARWILVHLMDSQKNWFAIQANQRKITAKLDYLMQFPFKKIPGFCSN